IRFRVKRFNSPPLRKARQRSPSHFGSNNHPSREKRSSVSVASIGATHLGCALFCSRAFASAGSTSNGLRSAIVPPPSLLSTEHHATRGPWCPTVHRQTAGKSAHDRAGR